jgi:hypothetical protein
MIVKRATWMKPVVLLIFVFAASAVFAAAISGITQAAPDLTWPLLFNGIAPGAILAFVGKRYIDQQDKTNKELITSKNDHTTRLGEIEMIHQLRGCDQPDKMLRGRRKEDV